MSEGPPRGGAPKPGDEAEGKTAKKGQSDPLFDPAGLKTRRTVMGLAPAPHLGGANRASATQAEERKQRVLARIAAMEAGRTVDGDSQPPGPKTDPPPPQTRTASMPAPPTRTSSIPPRPPPYLGPSGDSPPRAVEQTYMGPPPKRPSNAPPDPLTRTQVGPLPSNVVSTSTAILTPHKPAGVTLGPRRTVSSDGQLPASAGWDVYEEEQPNPAAAKAPERPIPEVATEVMEAAPTTARMLHVASPTDGRRAEPAPVPVQATPSSPVHAPPSSPVYATPSAVPPAALALRPYEPSYARHAISGDLDKRIVLLSEPHSARAASFRLLRDSLVSKSMPRVVAVSSAMPGDGKTTCAINLALSLAEQNATRVLLIDGNFFDPELGNIFGIERLSAILPPDGGAWLAPFKLVEITPGLHVAGIVRRAGESPPRFEQQRFDAMIERLVRVSYDYIIIDTPAMRATPAVIQMISAADGTLLAVRSGGTTARDLRRAADQIPKNKALGIALVDETPQS